MENLIDIDTDKKCIISTFCEEPRAAYNRVKVSNIMHPRNQLRICLKVDV